MTGESHTGYRGWRRWIAGATCAFAAHAGAAEPDSQAVYPVRPIRMIVASSAGTADDFFARSLARELADIYRQNVVIDNRPGAGGLIGNARVSRATPDGYTLGMVGLTRIVSELMHDEAPYRALADISGVAHVASITYLLAITSSIHPRNVPEFLTYARVRPGQLNYASLGIGSSSHVAAEIFMSVAGIDAVHVPFRILSDAFVELVRGRVHCTVLAMPAALPVVREGRLRPLAVMTSQRSPALPEVPTIAEAGLPEARFDNWSGIVVRRGTPRRIIEQLHGDIVSILRRPGIRERFARQGAESTPDDTPESFTRLMQQEYLHYQALISASHTLDLTAKPDKKQRVF
jgi:tripartite-type tricarboxylate transporter receptor subunit TctC